MKEGCELNALVAEKIMGIDLSPRQETFEDDSDGPNRISFETRTVSPKPKAYSTDIAAAWEVTEKFVHIDLAKDNSGTWTCILPVNNELTDGGLHVTAKAESAALAICLAALKAVGVEPPNAEG